MPPDADHDGDSDIRDYYDDLGGAYYFAPKDIDDGRVIMSRRAGAAYYIFVALFWLGVMLVGLFLMSFW